MQRDKAFLKILREFCGLVTEKMSQFSLGAPEDQLRGPFENFIRSSGAVFDWVVVPIGEARPKNIRGWPDYAIYLDNLLVGYVELKAPGVGAMASRFRGRNWEQFKRFSAIPNILYTDGNEWALYRSGEQIGDIVRLAGCVELDGKRAALLKDAQALRRLLLNFFSWQPIVPANDEGRVSLKDFAVMLAPLCRMLCEEVLEALQDPSSPVEKVAQSLRELLFPDASDEQIADSYAQTVTFALLLGRSEGADPLTLASAQTALVAEHSLLARVLQVLTDSQVRAEINVSLDLLIRVLSAVPPATFGALEDPWLYFYEDFLAAYNPELRKSAGAYYTPIEVVKAQISLVDDLLRNRLGKKLGFADSSVTTLDPAVGTGTYLLGVIEHVLEKVKTAYGEGALPGFATDLASNLYGFEIMVGPYAVSDLRISQSLAAAGAELPAGGIKIHLTNTLENPYAITPDTYLFHQPIAQQHEKATNIKSRVPILVCIGNPPYERHEAARTDNKASTGAWVRWGHREGAKRSRPILKDFIDPVIEAKLGGYVKNLYNLYIYFWRWALWKVLEQNEGQKAGVVSLVTAASYLDGDAFVGMRQHIRKICDEIWILDLGGEGRGTRPDENIFDNVQIPVAIAVAFRRGALDSSKPAKVRYASVRGSRAKKISFLKRIRDFKDIEWKDCPQGWQEPFRPEGEGRYFRWPLLTDLLPWQHSGVQFQRTWPISSDQETLQRRWETLLVSSDRAELFKETRDRKINATYKPIFDAIEEKKSIAELPENTPPPCIKRYGYRSFDRKWAFIDSRLGDYLRPVFWYTHSEKQVYLVSLLSHPLGSGPAITVSSLPPDLNYFRGSFGGKNVMPLYRTADGKIANIPPKLLKLLSQTYRRTVTAEDLIAYIYAVLAQPLFTSLFYEELGTCEIRLPITKDRLLFNEMQKIGEKLLWLHTFGERYQSKNKKHIPQGIARCTKPVPSDPSGYPESFEFDEVDCTLNVGQGKFQPVRREVFDFEVSGLKVVQSWLAYRMKEGRGRRSSALDDIRPKYWTSQSTTELLELLWVLEATLEIYSEQAELLETVVKEKCFRAEDLPPVPASMRRAPASPGALLEREPYR